MTAAIQISKVDPSLQLALAEQVLSRKITVRNVREAAVAASQKAGLHIRRRALEPRKLWESVRGNMQQALRASQNLERLLKEANIKAAIHGRVQIDVWTLLNVLKKPVKTLRNARQRLSLSDRTDPLRLHSLIPSRVLSRLGFSYIKLGLIQASFYCHSSIDFLLKICYHVRS